MIVNSFDFNFSFRLVIILLSLIGKEWPMHSGRIVFPSWWAFFQNGNSANAFIVIEANTTFEPFLVSINSLHGLRSTDLSGESSRHRNMPAGHAAQALSCRDQGKVSRSTLADANEKRDWRIYATLLMCDRNGQRVVCGRGLRAANHRGCLRSGFHHDRPVSLAFPVGLFSATQRRHQTPYRDDLRGSIPCVIRITHGKVHDVTSWISWSSNLPRSISWTVDTSILLASIGSHKTWRFCNPSQKQPRLHPTISHSIDSGTGLRSDQTILLKVQKPLNSIPIHFGESVLRYPKPSSPYLSDEQLCLTSPDDCSAFQTSLEDRVVLQMDQTKSSDQAFYGTSENAVKTQIWIAISVYVLVAIIKKKLRIERTLNEILQILSITILKTMNYYHYLQIFTSKNKKEATYNQLTLFNF